MAVGNEVFEWGSTTSFTTGTSTQGGLCKYSIFSTTKCCQFCGQVYPVQRNIAEFGPNFPYGWGQRSSAGFIHSQAMAGEAWNTQNKTKQRPRIET
jgi:hypothetical protein